MNYEDMLKKGRKELPEVVFQKERFEIPKIKGHIEGNKTILSNFAQIVQTLRRDSDHLLKFILKELATPGKVRAGGVVVIGRKVSASMVNEKIRKYAEEFVLCRECGKPDTKLISEEGLSYIRCMACGAKHPVKSKI